MKYRRENFKSGWLLRLKINSKGMTLVEMLIVVSIVSVLSIALYHSLTSGIRVWRRSHQVVTEENVLIFFEKFNRDIHNTFIYAKLPFAGDASRFNFPSIVMMPSEQSSDSLDGGLTGQLGLVEYFFDAGKNALMRRQANYSEALNDSWSDPVEIVPSVAKIEFRYFYLTERGENVSQEVLNAVPSGVEVTVQTQDQQGVRKMTRLFDIPLGS